ncbi:MAG: ABC transporter [Thermodesulfovibrio sp.]|nr:ABC transporter [Thermodesulfovibrio sp.]
MANLSKAQKNNKGNDTMKTLTIMIVFPLLLLSLVTICPAASSTEESVPVPEAAVQSPGSQVPGNLHEQDGTSGGAATKNEVKAPVDEPIDDNEMTGEEGPRIADPFAPTNRIMFEVNDRLYFWILKPVTQAYAHIPEDFRVVFSNIYDNLKAPGRAINNLLQLRLKGAGNELLRFVINSFVGVGGMGDAARDAFGIKKQEADFGQTLGRYGFDHGFYLVWPVLGPSSLRDTVGRAGDHFLHPLTYVHHEDLSTTASVGISVHERVNDASFRMGDYESFKEAAIDPYTAMRDAFVQHRKKKVQESLQD